MPRPDYTIRGVPQLQQQQGPLGALTDFAKGKALSAGLEAAFPGGGIAKEAAEAVAPTFFDEGGKVPWWKAAAQHVWKNDNLRSDSKDKYRTKNRKNKQGPSKGDVGSVLGSFLSLGFQGGGGVPKPIYQRMGGMTPGPLGMSDMLEAGKGKDVAKVVYKKKGGDIEDQVEIAYHAPLAAKPKSGE